MYRLSNFHLLIAYSIVYIAMFLANFMKLNCLNYGKNEIYIRLNRMRMMFTIFRNNLF